MVKNLKKLFLICVSLLVGISFVLAASGAPTKLIFNSNVTANYDEGSFFVNWTSGGGDAEANYTVYLFSNNTFYATAQNTSTTGYPFSNTTEANYTFIVQAWNATGNKVNSSTNISIYVDRSPPTITVPHYTNATSKQNTATLTLNISVIDARSGETGSVCLIDVNGTSNQSISVSNGWCNSTVINLTASSDGNHSIRVYVNDTVNNVGLNNSYVVQVDTTAPVPVLSCSPLSVYPGHVITCTCSATDATSGVSTISYTASPSTSSSGTFTTFCNVNDTAGNWGNGSTTYEVIWRQAGVQGSITTSSWEKSYAITEEQFTEGYTKNLAVNNRIKIRIQNIEHHVGVKGVTQDSVTIEIASESVEIILNVGEEAKVDIAEDGYYDIYVLLNSILNNQANVTVKGISEEVLEGDESVLTTGEINGEDEEIEEGGEEEGRKEKSSWWIWVIVIVVLIIIGVGWKKNSEK